MDIPKWLEGSEELAHRLERPAVTLSYAQSLDGCISLGDGQPVPISGPEAMRVTHQIRAAHDAILVGVGTVLADDPQLNVRLAAGRNPQPVVLDTFLRIPNGCRLLKREKDWPWVAAGKQADPKRCAELERLGARVFLMESDSEGRIYLPELLSRLYRMGVQRLMVEGGAQVITSFLEQQLVDAVAVCVAPVYLGGLRAAGSRLAVRDVQEPQEVCAPTLTEVVYESVGRDQMVWGKLRKEKL
jgi:riboflavin-specific deaminase-like protein